MMRQFVATLFVLSACTTAFQAPRQHLASPASGAFRKAPAASGAGARLPAARASAPLTVRHVVIPGDSVAEMVTLGGFINFLGIYNTIITARILLSW